MDREPGWNRDVAAALIEAAEGLPDAKVGKMFGYPALYAGGKLFACAYGDGVGLKLPAEVVGALVEQEGFEPFRPYGKAGMREWAFLKATDRETVHANAALLEQAALFVAGSGRRRPARQRARPPGS